MNLKIENTTKSLPSGRRVAVLNTGGASVIMTLAKRLDDEQKLVDELARWVRRNRLNDGSWEDRLADALLQKVGDLRA